MKHRIAILTAIAIALSFPVSVHANEPAVSPAAQEKPMESMNCPMMGNMNSMQKNMGSMMGDMDSMMKMTSDPAMKEHMQKMHEKMAAMMQQMSGMPKMCGKNCPMMEKMGMEKMGEEKVNIAPSAPATVSPEDHKAHHPEKQ